MPRLITIPEQLVHALVHGPLAIFRLRGRAVAWLAVYLGLASLILYFVGSFLVGHRGDLVRIVVDHLFPEDWRFAGELLVERVIAAQDRVVLVNAFIGATLVVVAALLFPVKEALSSAFERESRLVTEEPNEFPLWFQAWEEVVLLMLFVAAQGTIFWIGYAPDPSRRALASVLSYVFLFASFGLDFLTPVMQRHRQKYSTMLKVLAQHPVMWLAFGAVFTLPAIIVGRWVAGHPELSFRTALIVLFATNVTLLAWAAVAGTHVGAQLLPDARRTRPPARGTRLLAWLALLGVLGWNGYRFGAVGLSLHHKSQILKCEYTLDWTSIGVETPSALGLAFALREDRVEVGVHFDVLIENPTTTDVELEKNRVEITHDGQKIAQASLTPVRVPAGGRTRQTVRLPLRLTPSQLARGRDLLRAEGWAITLYLDVAPGFEFPVYILEAAR